MQELRKFSLLVVFERALPCSPSTLTTNSFLLLVGMDSGWNNDLMIWLISKSHYLHILPESCILNQWFQTKFESFKQVSNSLQMQFHENSILNTAITTVTGNRWLMCSPHATWTVTDYTKVRFIRYKIWTDYHVGRIFQFIESYLQHFKNILYPFNRVYLWYLHPPSPRAAVCTGI